ncbi:MAG: hypothetical protein ACR2FY_11830 [Pirellulaceae bacterium]
MRLLRNVCFALCTLSIRDLLVVSVIVAVLAVWWVERSRLAKEIRSLTPQHSDSGGVLISPLAFQGGITRFYSSRRPVALDTGFCPWRMSKENVNPHWHL